MRRRNSDGQIVWFLILLSAAAIGIAYFVIGRDAAKVDAPAAVAIEPPSTQKVILADRQPTQMRPSGSSAVSSEKTVHVHGYTRKDGTVVQPYDRRPPSRGGRR